MDFITELNIKIFDRVLLILGHGNSLECESRYLLYHVTSSVEKLSGCIFPFLYF